MDFDRPAFLKLHFHSEPPFGDEICEGRSGDLDASALYVETKLDAEVPTIYMEDCNKGKLRILRDGSLTLDERDRLWTVVGGLCEIERPHESVDGYHIYLTLTRAPNAASTTFLFANNDGYGHDDAARRYVRSSEGDSISFVDVFWNLRHYRPSRGPRLRGRR